MRALVVYESMFGNTWQVAQAVADGLARHVSVDVELVEVGAAGVPGDDVALVVVGVPTHGHGMSRPQTRPAAAGPAAGRGTAGPRQSGLVSRGAGVREWLAALPLSGRTVPAATFDTRFARPRWLTGSAAVGAARGLRRRGYRLIAQPESFFVTATLGPLAPGEVDRARQWGETLGIALATAGPAQPVR